MSKVGTLEIGRHRVVIAAHETVWSPTPYSLLLSEEAFRTSPTSRSSTSAPDPGSWALSQVCKAQLRVYVVDTNPAAIVAGNGQRGAERGAKAFPFFVDRRQIIPLPSGETVDVVISNPPQLPLPKPEANNPNYAGSDGPRGNREAPGT